MRSIKQQVAALHAAYDKDIQRICAEARTKYVIPYCDKHNLMFGAGMGSWCFHDEEGQQYGAENGWQEPIPKRLLAILETELLYRNDLGSLIEDYTPHGFKRRQQGV
jgi:hypothetical protein